MHAAASSFDGDAGLCSSTLAALVRAIHLRCQGRAIEADREEVRAVASVYADCARSGPALESVVRAVRSAWDRVHGPVGPIVGRELAYYRLVSRCLRSCVEADEDEKRRELTDARRWVIEMHRGPPATAE